MAALVAGLGGRVPGPQRAGVAGAAPAPAPPGGPARYTSGGRASASPRPAAGGASAPAASGSAQPPGPGPRWAPGPRRLDPGPRACRRCRGGRASGPAVRGLQGLSCAEGTRSGPRAGPWAAPSPGESYEGAFCSRGGRGSHSRHRAPSGQMPGIRDP